MGALLLPEVGARSAWMRNSLAVAALAGEAGAEDVVPGASLWGPTAGSHMRPIRC